MHASIVITKLFVDIVVGVLEDRVKVAIIFTVYVPASVLSIVHED